MNTYEIRITNKADDNDFETIEITAEATSDLSYIIERAVNYSDEIELDLDNGEVIAISQNSEHGYNADAYKDRKAFVDGDDPIGGGLCTGTFCDAIEMALTER